jgi:hypothetical protein
MLMDVKKNSSRSNMTKLSEKVQFKPFTQILNLMKRFVICVPIVIECVQYAVKLCLIALIKLTLSFINQTNKTSSYKTQA